MSKELKASRFLLTVSQVGEGVNKQEPFDLESLKLKVISKYRDRIAYCCIGRERHKDKGWHCHIFVHLNRRAVYTLKTFNFLFEKETNIKIVGATKEDRRKALSYTKKAQDYIEFGNADIDIEQQKIGNLHSYVVKAIKEGITYEKLVNHEIKKISEYVLRNRANVKGMIADIKVINNELKLEQMKGIRYIDKELMKEVLSKGEREAIKRDIGLQKVIEHINVMNSSKGARVHKSKNLLLWSKRPNVGKTSLFEKIMKYCPSYGFPIDQWFQDYRSDLFWMIYWNEMTLAGINLEMLNSFLEGIPVRLAIKGSSIVKTDNPHVFMTSNRDLKTMINRRCINESEEEKEVMLNALRARIDEVCVDDYENIFFLSKLIVSVV